MNRRTLLSFLTLTSSALFVASATAQRDTPRYETRTIRNEGRAYRYTLCVPSGLRRTHPAPLIVLCGGSPGTRILVQANGWETLAHDSGVLIAVPQGNVSPHLIEEISRDYAVDAGQVAETVRKQFPLYGFAKTSSASFGPHKTGAMGQIIASSFNGDTPEGDKAISDLVWDFFMENARAKTDVKLKVGNLRSDRGRVLISLFDTENGFPDDSRKAVATGEAMIEEGKAVVTFRNLTTPRLYAAILLHDENGNEEMDLSFGFPTEGFAATNNPKFGYGLPKFADAKFRMTATAKELPEIKMVYLGSGERAQN